MYVAAGPPQLLGCDMEWGGLIADYKETKMASKTLKTVLLVEDSQDDAYLVELEFKKTGTLQLRWVRDGEEAVNYLEGKSPYDDRREYPIPDVILLDIKMPRMDGFGFLGWLRNQAFGAVNLIPVIMMSGSDLEEDVKTAYGLGVNLYLTKPVDWNKFRERMRLLGVLWSEHVETPAV